MFPTRVGMNRAKYTVYFGLRYVPHTRGDEPMKRPWEGICKQCSPHAWG